MMTDAKEAWSDLQRARESTRLLGVGCQRPATAGPKNASHGTLGGYTRFRTSITPSARVSPPGNSGREPSGERPGPSATRSAAPLPLLPSSGISSWAELLAWAASVAQAESCFVVDAQGFVLAHHGDWSYEDIEDVGSQLTLIMTRADDSEATGRSRAITLEFGEYWLSGTRVQFAEVGELTFVLITRDALDRELVITLARQVEQAMQRF